MTHEDFNKLLDELDGNSLQTLKQKNAKYAPEDDALHNFHAGAEVSGGTTAQACWGYLTKHLVALRDKVQNNDFHDRDDLLEKCQDSINYIRFLWCIGNEEMDKCPRGMGAADEAPNEAYAKQKADWERRMQELATTGGTHDYWWQHDCIKNDCSDGVTADIQR